MQAKVTHYYSLLKEILQNERQQWFLWIPVLYSIGILIYFGLPFEPHIKYIIIIFAGITVLMLSSQYFTKSRIKKAKIFHILLIFFITTAGFLGANFKAIYVNSPILKKDTGFIDLTGRIEKVTTYKTGHRVVLTNIVTDKIPKDATPKKIRLTVFTDMKDTQAGDIITTRAALKAPPKPVAPGAYNFARHAYFEQIGAVGFAVSSFTKIRATANNKNDLLSKIRDSIATRLEASIGGTEAEIAKATLIGDTGGIKASTIDKIRDAGLAHLLAISGLHLALVCGIFFTLTRTTLSAIPYISLNYNTKKIAAIFAIMGSYFYLLISGSPVSAERSFIISTLVLIAIIIDRIGTPLRLVAIAAICILIFSPENILSPSFQMSFSAVIALIAAFEFFTPRLKLISENFSIPGIVINIISIALASIVATIATAPFGIYHFNRSSPYGIFANVIAVPLTSIVIMPLEVASLITMPMHLDWIFAEPLKLAIKFLVYLSDHVSKFPYASTIIPAIMPWQLISISFGFLWLCLWKSKWRLFGLPIIIICFTFTPFNKTPDIIISKDGELFAVKDENGNLLFSSNKKGKYQRNVWSLRNGQNKENIPAKNHSNSIKCDSSACIYSKNGYKAAFIIEPFALESECMHYKNEIFINLTGIKYNCTLALEQINRYNLHKNGTHQIFLDKDIAITTVANEQKRLWE